MCFLSSRMAPHFMQGVPVSQAITTAKYSSDKVTPSARVQQASAAVSQPGPLHPGPTKHRSQAHTKATTIVLEQPNRNGRPSQGKPAQKRKQALAVPQQQKVKQQRLVYNEFSTSTESTIDSDCTMPLADDEEEGTNPGKHLVRDANRLETQQQQQQKCQFMSVNEPYKLLPAAAGRQQRPVPSPSKGKQLPANGVIYKQGQPRQKGCAATALGHMRPETNSRQGAQLQKPAAVVDAAKGSVYKRQLPVPRTACPAAQPRGLLADGTGIQPAGKVISQSAIC